MPAASDPVVTASLDITSFDEVLPHADSSKLATTHDRRAIG